MEQLMVYAALFCLEYHIKPSEIEMELRIYQHEEGWAMNPIQKDILMHYGVNRRSGCYPRGSGDNPYQHGGDFLSSVEEIQKLGKSEVDKRF